MIWVRTGRFRLHPRIAISEASILFEFTIKSARKLAVEPPVNVGQDFCYAATHDVLYVSLFTAMSSPH